jgi:hypothetical protein
MLAAALLRTGDVNLTKQEIGEMHICSVIVLLCIADQMNAGCCCYGLSAGDVNLTKQEIEETQIIVTTYTHMQIKTCCQSGCCCFVQVT